MKQYLLPVFLAISISASTIAKPNTKALQPFRFLVAVVASTIFMTQSIDALTDPSCKNSTNPYLAGFAENTLIAILDNNQIKIQSLFLLKVDQEVLSHFTPDGEAIFSTVDFICLPNLKNQNQLVEVCTKSSCIDLAEDSLIPVEGINGNRFNALARDINTNFKVLEGATFKSVISSHRYDAKNLSQPVTDSGLIAVKKANSKDWLIATTRASLDRDTKYIYYGKYVLISDKNKNASSARRLLGGLFGFLAAIYFA